MNEQSHDIVIIGSGPAGYTAAIYAARGGHPPVLVEGMQPGGQLTITTDIENFPGFPDPIGGGELMDRMRAQAARFGTTFVADEVQGVTLDRRPFVVRLGSGRELLARTLIIATGAQARWLGLPSEQEFQGRGVSACATCDGFFFRGKTVAVIGGGDTACEEAVYLTNHADRVYLVHRRDELRASRIMARRALEHPKITALLGRIPERVLGDDSGVTGLALKDVKSGELETVALDGVFIAIGHEPTTGFLGDALARDEHGYLRTVPGSTRTSVPGVFAAGDVQDSVYRQAVTAAGTGCMAAIESLRFLEAEGT